LFPKQVRTKKVFQRKYDIYEPNLIPQMPLPDDQIKEIHDLLLAYAAGEYHKKGKVSYRRDEIDMIIAGVNMLGEELLAITVSRDYFNSIYSAVADMVFVVSSKGIVEDVNSAVSNILNFETSDLVKQPIKKIITPDNASFFSDIKKKLSTKSKSYTFETQFHSSNSRLIPVSCSCTKIIDRKDQFKGYLIIAEDITERKETEQLILRTIVDTQEKEQKRIVVDLHDSLGQELSMIKLVLNAIEEHCSGAGKKLEEGFENCQSMLDNSIVHLRSICFDMMPTSLESGGINDALRELIKKLSPQNSIHCHYDCPDKSLPLMKSHEIVLYRIAQEFINNSTKLANARNIYIKLSCNSDKVNFSLSDDGCGFKINDNKLKKGRGLNNMESRVRAFNGTFKMMSEINDGTKLLVTFPTK